MERWKLKTANNLFDSFNISGDKKTDICLSKVKKKKKKKKH